MNMRHLLNELQSVQTSDYLDRTKFPYGFNTGLTPSQLPRSNTTSFFSYLGTFQDENSDPTFHSATAQPLHYRHGMLQFIYGAYRM
ncbi:hypothetical protein J6590_021379 [Homalodisca vitripennis]|nr:hypothetical protein J6590_021379 [Homalodisca vitripennis]